jgi:hypothetical protein
MRCQACGISAPTKHVSFYQNIGALVMRFSRSIQGDLCKPCIHKYFWEFTSITLFAGWFGIISFIITPFLILNNVFRYLGCLSLPSPETSHRDRDAEVVYQAKASNNSKDECYLCGRQLQPEEWQARVCQTCRS